jgi:nitroreductase
MNINEAILTRRSIRSYRPDPVPRGIIEKLLDTSRWSPSGSNTQPWEFAVLGGKVLEEVNTRLIKNMQAGNAHPDIPYPPMPEPYVSRQKTLIKLMDAYQFTEGTKDVKEKRASNRISSIRFFDAPSAIIIYTDKEICPRAFLGLGMVAQTICLAALEYGLGTCIMSVATFWPEIYHELLGIPESKLIAFGIALGYPDVNARINTFERTREPLDSSTHWYGI